MAVRIYLHQYSRQAPGRLHQELLDTQTPYAAFSRFFALSYAQSVMPVMI